MHSLAAATEAIEWGECYGLTLDPDQHATLRAGLGERVDGSWAASEVCDVKGRQAGKNDTAKVRQGAGVDLFGERLILHTAHEFPTANEDFLRLVAVYEAYDDLRKKVSRIRYANGEQGIEFLSGARIKYRARTGGSGRGFAEADCVIYDELQHLQPEHLGASFPTMLANPNFQAWYCGSGGFSFSGPAHSLRRRAILGDGGRFAYTENTAQIVEVVDGEIVLSSPLEMLSHESLMTHPGYANGRVSFEAFETMFWALGAEMFGREILCIWESEPNTSTADMPIDTAQFAQLADGQSEPVSGIRICLDADPNRQAPVFAIAGIRADGLSHVSVRHRVKRTDGRTVKTQVIEAAKKLTEAHGCDLVMPPGSPARAWLSELVAAGVEVDEMTAGEYAEGCGAIVSAVEDGSLRHRGQADLNEAVAGLAVRSSGDVDVWSRRKASVNIAPFVAATCALVRVPEKSSTMSTEPMFAVT